jgi:L-lactate dehydrogenase (cytochrome)
MRFTWDDIASIRRLWDRKLVLKGIMDAEDKPRAIDAGAVSNHGGRQLDGAPASLLPAIAKAINGQTEMWLDGDVGSGQDVLRAIAWAPKGR